MSAAADDEAEREHAATVADLRQQIDVLVGRLNQWEQRFACHSVVEQLLRLMLKHYEGVRAGLGAPPLAVAQRFYILHNGKCHALPVQKERLIESLWLSRVERGVVHYLGADREVKLHPKQLHDDKPLPLLMFDDKTPLPIKRQADAWRHSFLCKHGPNFPGAVLDATDARAWYAQGSFATAQDTLLSPGSHRLEALAALWLGRAAHDPPDATLLVDAKAVRHFVSKLAQNDRARCHFMCLGQTRLYAYFVLTAADGFQTELARLPLGHVTL